MPRAVYPRCFLGQTLLRLQMLAVVCVFLTFANPTAFSQSSASPSTTSQQKTRQHRHPHAVRHAGMPASKTPTTSALPATPVYPIPPAQQPAVAAIIQYQDNQLTIDAKNSSLSQILAEVSRRTGLEIKGLSGDQRVYGQYGPGTVSQTLSALLNGSPYNYVIIGGDAKHPATQLLLTSSGGTFSAVPSAGNSTPPVFGSNPENANPQGGTAMSPAPTPAGPPSAQQLMDSFRQQHPEPEPQQPDESTPPEQ